MPADTDRRMLLDITENDSRYFGKSYETITSTLLKTLSVRFILIDDCYQSVIKEIYDNYIVGLQAYLSLAFYIL